MELLTSKEVLQNLIAIDEEIEILKGSVSLLSDYERVLPTHRNMVPFVTARSARVPVGDDLATSVLDIHLLT